MQTYVPYPGGMILADGLEQEHKETYVLYSDVERLQAEKEGLREALIKCERILKAYNRASPADFKLAANEARSALGSGGDEQTATKGEVR